MGLPGASAASLSSAAADSAMQDVAIIDYGSGNLHSAAKAFERAARDSGCEARILVTSDPDAVRAADRIVLPGVGAFADCKRGLDAVPGMREALESAVRRAGRPFLGICVGQQLLATRGLEHGITAGLDWIPGEVRVLEPADPSLKIPHMGWNTLDVLRPHPLLAGLPTGPDGLHAYFVHSYHLVPDALSDVIARTSYGGPVTALVGRDNIAGTQFHPEKSQRLGLGLIANFLAWRP
jgi:glutamine amidotransferase